MIITISGTPGSGKSSTSKALANVLCFSHHSAGMLMRNIAKKKGKSLLEINRMAEGKIDKIIDERSRELGEKKDGFVMDGRMSFYFIPHSFKIFLKVSPKTAAKRIWDDLVAKRRRGEGQTFADVVKKVKKRTVSEKMRYKKQYGVDYTDQRNYDLVIDTEYFSLEETVSAILGRLADNGLLK